MDNIIITTTQTTSLSSHRQRGWKSWLGTDRK